MCGTAAPKPLWGAYLRSPSPQRLRLGAQMGGLSQLIGNSGDPRAITQLAKRRPAARQGRCLRTGIFAPLRTAPNANAEGFAGHRIYDVVVTRESTDAHTAEAPPNHPTSLRTTLTATAVLRSHEGRRFTYNSMPTPASRPWIALVEPRFDPGLRPLSVNVLLMLAPHPSTPRALPASAGTGATKITASLTVPSSPAQRVSEDPE